MFKSVTISGVIKKIKKYLPNLNEERIKKAYEFAKKAHKGQMRSSGKPYIQHPLEVAMILTDLHPDEDSIISALLHDVVEDTKINIDEIETEFGAGVVPLLNGLEKLSRVYYRGEERQIENLRKMFLAMSKDIRVILIKLADRLHNMRTLEFVPEEKRKRIAQETITIYSPIAGRLGIFRLKNELDDLCFKFLHPKEYERLGKELREASGWQKGIVKTSKNILYKTLKDSGIEAEIEGRVKHAYSIFKKLKKKDKNYVTELYDIFALRVIVEDEAQCYQALGIIHKNWAPLARRFKDYVAVPKTNGYQSLHTTLIGLCPKIHNQPIEIQIRSKSMNDVAKFGVAAHWQYKEKDGNSIAVPSNRITWVQNLVSIHENYKNNDEFFESINLDVLHDQIFVLTPNGEVLDLPSDATPVDFAYAIHTNVGNRCKGAKINGKIVPLDRKLKNGQVVEILTSTIDRPNRYWLSFVVTAQAKTRIKQWFNNQDGDKLLKIGKEIINNHLKRFNQDALDPNLSFLKVYNKKKLTIREREQLIIKVGNGSLDSITLIKDILPAEKVMRKKAQDLLAKEVLTENIQIDKDSEILIGGEKGFKTQIATCCMPKVGDGIIGYITRGRGVSVHNSNCKMLHGLDPKRFIKVNWNTKKQVEYEVTLRLKRKSRVGLLRDVAEVFASSQLPIIDIQNIKYEDTDMGEMIIIASLDSLETLDSVIQQLEALPGIFEVKEIE